MKKASVLLVDDDDVYVESLSKLLKGRGYDVKGARDGPAAIGIMEEHDPDVVLLDLWMPGIDGIETLREIKAKRPRIQVIILTGHADAGTVMSAFTLEAFDYRPKTARLTELLERIDKAFLQKLMMEQVVPG